MGVGAADGTGRMLLYTVVSSDLAVGVGKTAVVGSVDTASVAEANGVKDSAWPESVGSSTEIVVVEVANMATS